MTFLKFHSPSGYPIYLNKKDVWGITEYNGVVVILYGRKQIKIKESRAEAEQLCGI